jgi:hypothetical protein
MSESSEGAVSVRGQLVVALVLVAVGVGVLALPASVEGPRLVEFSPDHGPSALDAFGIVPLVIGGMWLNVALVRGLPAMRLGARWLFGAGVLAGFGLGALVASVYAGFASWWIIGAAVLGLATTVLAGTLFLRGQPAT